MAVAIDCNFPGATTDQYDEAVKMMGLASGGQHPGALFHWATQTESGVRVVDVWESKEDFERFAQERSSPSLSRWGCPSLRSPTTTFTPHGWFLACVRRSGTCYR
jgi:hypothetical protein